jgi:hypothetical protein
VVKYFHNLDEKWFEIINQQTHEVARYGRLDIFKILAESNIFPTALDLNIAAENGYYDIIEWAAIYEIYPDGNGCNLALFNQHYRIVTFLIKHDIQPTTFAFGRLIDRNRIDDIEILLISELKPTFDHIMDVIKSDNIAIMELFLQYDCVKDASCFFSLLGIKAEIVKLLLEYGCITKSS